MSHRQVSHSPVRCHTEASSTATLVPGDHTGSRLQISSTAFAACLVAAGRVEEEEEGEEEAGDGEDDGEGGGARCDDAVVSDFPMDAREF